MTKAILSIGMVRLALPADDAAEAARLLMKGQVVLYGYDSEQGSVWVRPDKPSGTFLNLEGPCSEDQILDCTESEFKERLAYKNWKKEQEKVGQE